MPEAIRDQDFPARMNPWQTLRFLLSVESPRISELRMGLWTFLYGGVFALSPHIYASSATYGWLLHVPAAAVGWPLIFLGAFQVMSVLTRNTRERQWAARIQCLVSLLFLVGCTVSSVASPAWCFFGLNLLASAWCLYRISPAAPAKDAPVKADEGVKDHA